jgi:hypothetical protein
MAGAERTFLSRIAAAYVGRRLFPKIKVTILPPQRLATIRPARPDEATSAAPRAL